MVKDWSLEIFQSLIKRQKSHFVIHQILQRRLRLKRKTICLRVVKL